MTFATRILSILALLALAGCGGGGGSAGTPPFGGGGGGGGGSSGNTPVAADLVLVLSSATLPNDRSQTALATVIAVDANRNTVAGVPVQVSVDSEGTVTRSSSVTDESGLLTAEIGIGGSTANRTMTVTATSGSITRTATLEVRDPTPGGVAGPTLDIALSTSLVTPRTSAQATLTLRSASGTPLAGVTVALATGRTDLAVLDRASVLTNADGQARVTVLAGSEGLTGADDLLAVATVGSTQVSGRAGFEVAGASPTIAFKTAPTTLRASDGPSVVRVEVRDARGLAVSGRLVSFASAQGLVGFSTASALTDAGGMATVRVRPLDGSVSAADVLQARATVAGRELQSDRGIQLVGEAPSIRLTLSSSTVRPTTPATLNATVRDAAGAFVANAVVSFDSQFGLAAFDAATATTSAGGKASVVVSPRTAGTTGADVLRARVTVAGVTRTREIPVQFVGTGSPGAPVLTLSLSRTSISAAGPATVTARLTDARGQPAAGQVVTFDVVRGLATTNVATALTNDDGRAVVVLSPANSAAAGADEVSASASYAGTQLQATRGFQVQATDVALQAFTSATSPLSAYAQTTLTITLSGANVTTPVNLSISSACVALGKATLSPSRVSTTSNTVAVQYRDNGCGAVQGADQLQVVVDGTAVSRSLRLPVEAPSAASLAFVQALPEQIYLKGSGFTESSVVSFEVRDAAGNPLPGRGVELRLQTGAGGVTMEGRGVESVDPASANPFVQTSDALGRVSARVNSGTQPTPVRIHARLAGTAGGTPIATVSSNLGVAIGLPSQLNFSFSQGARNIEGYDLDGTANTYQIITADRAGNPVPAGTSVNFVAEGGQIEAVRQTQVVNGIARTTANFVSAEPRPHDGRVTITAYALGEESFVDLDGNNRFDAGEPFQDLGSVFKDRLFDGNWDAATDEFIPLQVNDGSACVAPASALLALDAGIPSRPGTCDGTWSGAGQVYVRRALETVLSTSAARPLWPAGTPRLVGTGTSITMQVGADPSSTASYRLVAGDTVCGYGSGALTLLVADANPVPRLNPMAAGTEISASTPTSGFSTTVVAGSPVPSSSEASAATLTYSFDDAAVEDATMVVTFRSPVSRTGTSASLRVVRGATATALGCP